MHRYVKWAALCLLPWLAGCQGATEYFKWSSADIYDVSVGGGQDFVPRNVYIEYDAKAEGMQQLQLNVARERIETSLREAGISVAANRTGAEYIVELLLEQGKPEQRTRTEYANREVFDGCYTYRDDKGRKQQECRSRTEYIPYQVATSLCRHSLALQLYPANKGAKRPADARPLWWARANWAELDSCDMTDGLSGSARAVAVVLLDPIRYDGRLTVRVLPTETKVEARDP